MRKKGRENPIANACNTVRSFADVPQNSLHPEVRERLRRACQLLLAEPTERLQPFQRALADKARDVLDGMTNVLPGVARKILKQHGEIVRDDPVVHGRRALAIKYWHGEPSNLTDPHIATTFIAHMKNVSALYEHLWASAKTHHGTVYFLFEGLPYSGNDTEGDLVKNHREHAEDMRKAHRSMISMEPDKLIHLLRERSKSDKSLLAMDHSALWPEIELLPWFFTKENGHLLLQGRPMERRNPYGAYQQNMNRLAIQMAAVTDAQLCEVQQTYVRAAQEDHDIRATFAAEQCKGIPEGANVVVLYGASHMSAGASATSDTFERGLDDILGTSFDVTVLDAFGHKECGAVFVPIKDMSPDDMRQELAVIQRHVHRTTKRPRLTIGDL